MRFRLRAGFAAFALAASGAHAGTVTLTGPATASPGDAVTVAVALSPDLADAVYALQGSVGYDAGVLTSAASQEATAPQDFYAGTPGNVYPGETIPKDADLFRLNANVAGSLLFGYVKNPSDPAGSASHAVPTTALQLRFTVAQNATGQTTLQFAPASVNGQSLPALILGAKDGSVVIATAGDPLTLRIIPPRIAGDANSDGAVTLDDAVLALQAAAGLPAQAGADVNVQNADVAGAGADGRAPDGHVGVEDALRILRYLNSLEADLN